MFRDTNTYSIFERTDFVVKRLKVAIVGGGIGGLAAANAMIHYGHDVTVYEQAQELGEVGAGVLITPNSIRLFDKLGLREDFEHLGGQITPGSEYRRMDGSVVGQIRTSDSNGEYGVYGAHRADLLNMLANALPSGVVHTAHQCIDVEQASGTVTLSFANGSQAEADVVVGADGIHSQLRKEVVTPGEPVFSGMVAYRGLVEASRLPNWRNDVHLVWMGEGKHFMAFPVRGGQLLNFVGFVPSEYPAQESWSGLGDVEDLVSAFSGWDPLITELIEQIDQPFWWGLFDREPLERWTTGHLALIGDAAHAMLPHLGQGANQAIEDGFALGAILAQRDSQSIAEALRQYEALRHPRATKVQLGARANGRRYDSQYEDLAQRDAEIAEAGRFRAWLYDYDVEQVLLNA